MRLKKTVRQHLQGIALLAIAYICHRTNADGAAIFALICGVVFLFGEDEGE